MISVQFTGLSVLRYRRTVQEDSPSRTPTRKSPAKTPRLNYTPHKLEKAFSSVTLGHSGIVHGASSRIVHVARAEPPEPADAAALDLDGRASHDPLGRCTSSAHAEIRHRSQVITDQRTIRST